MAPKQNFRTRIGKLLVSGLVVLSMVLVFNISCQQPAPAPSPEPTPTITEVDISGFAFVPATITIPAGTTVTWLNKDSAAHTVSSRGDMFDSGRMPKGATFGYTFDQSGTFEYYCTIHPAMIGKIIMGSGQRR